MPVLLQMDFPAEGPWGDEMSGAYEELGRSITGEPGFLWKIWTESRDDGRAGGLYLFDSRENARAYLDMHTARLEGFGVTGARSLIFDVNGPLTQITRGPVT